MLVRLGFDIQLSAPAPTPLVLALFPHPDEAHRLRAAVPVAEPDVPIRWHRDDFGNRRGRLVMPEGRLRLVWSDEATDGGRLDDVDLDAAEHPVGDLPDEVLRFLQPSRYCESDLLRQEARDRFGSAPPGWGRVQAICDHVHDRLAYDAMAASVFRTARSSLEDGKAVCRDFAHLVIAFARGLDIPARYVSGHLDDSAWSEQAPGEFCAWAEVYLGGRWHTFDARYNVPRAGRLVVARGCDASDVPMITSFGPVGVDAFQVWCGPGAASHVAA